MNEGTRISNGRRAFWSDGGRVVWPVTFLHADAVGATSARALRAAATAVLTAVLTGAVAVGLPTAAHAQGGVQAPERAGVTGSRYLPIGHWAYAYIDRLRARGLLENLDPLVRPYRRSDIGEGLRRITVRRLPEVERRWVELLRREFGPESFPPPTDLEYRVGGDVEAGARAGSHDRLDPLRPVGEGDLWPYGIVGAWLQAGPIAAVTRVRSDAWFPDDPDGEDVGRRLEARSEEAYVAAQFPSVSLFVGRVARNWGAAGAPGLMLSANPATYSQIGFELEAGPVAWRSVLAELDTVAAARRWLGAHRVDLTVSDDFRVAFGESILYGGPGAGLSPRFLNPLAFFFFDHDNAPADYTMNLMLDFQVWWREPGFVFHAEAMIDDLDVNPPEGADSKEPSQYALRAGIELPALGPRFDVSLDYTLASAFVYRTLNRVDDYLYLGRGLADNFSDYERVRLRIDLHTPMHGLILSPSFAFQREGEQSDLRQPLEFTRPEWRQQPTLFAGMTEKTIRAALAGRYQPTQFLWAEWDVGMNFISDAGHVEGADDSELVGLVRAGLRIRF